MTNDDKRLGGNLRAARKVRGLSQEALAGAMREAGQSHWRQTTVSRVENGSQEVSAAELLALEGVVGPGLIDGTESGNLLRAMGVGLERSVTLRHLRRVDEALAESQELVRYLREMYQDPELEDDGEH